MRYWLLAIAPLLGACSTTPAPTVIVDLQHDKVIVQSDSSTLPEDIVGKAAEGCAIHGRKPVPISETCAGGTSCNTYCYSSTSCITTCDEDCGTKHHLFACTE